MRAGELDQRISIERGEAVRGGLGVEPETAWAEFASRAARVRQGTGQERRQAASEGASAVATFLIRTDPLTKQITERDRIQWRALTWNISSVAPTPDRAGIEITATAAKG